jgi:two-component system copper resistance phosphate regulon response regulator CusR
MTKNLGVLVIEDDDDLRDLIADGLRNIGYQVTEAITGEDGVAKARAASPRMVILDILLPGMDGWQVLDALRTSEQSADVPILILSVLDPGTPEHRVDGYIVKPFTAAQIEQKVRELAGPPEIEAVP